MMTKPATKSSRAIALRSDTRPFLVQAVDHALASGPWTALDVDLLESDCVRLAFRYLAQRRWDLRDLDRVRTAMGIVCMFVDDGLRSLSDGDLDRAVAVLVSRPVSDCFRKSRNNDVEALRAALDAIGSELRIHVGPAGKGSGAVLMALAPELQDAFRSRAFSDEDLLEAFRDDQGITGVCAAIRQRIAEAQRHRRVLDLLPMAEITERWSHLLHSDAYAAAPDDAQNAYAMAWVGALVRATVRGDLGVVVRPADLDAFAAAGDPLDARVGADAAIRRALGPRLPPDDAPAIAVGLSDGAMALVALAEDAQDARWSRAALLNRWADVAFLEVTDEERALALAEEAAAIGDAAITVDRVAASTSAADRRALLDVLDVAALDSDALARVLAAADDRADAILARVDWDAQDTEAIATLLSAGLPDAVDRRIVFFFLARTGGIRVFSEDAVLMCILAAHGDTNLLAGIRQSWVTEASRCIQAFRADTAIEARWDWIRLAATSPDLLLALLHDARSFADETAAIASAITGSEDTGGEPLVSDTQLAAMFVAAQARASRRAHATPSFPDHARFPDRDVRWVWSLCSPQQRAAIRAAFAQARALKRRSTKRRSAKRRGTRPQRR